MASEHPDITIDRVTDKYGGLLAVGRSYEYVTIGGQAIPIEGGPQAPRDDQPGVRRRPGMAGAPG